jgi:MFS family permease
MIDRALHMPRFLKILLAFLLGLVAGWAIPIVWYIVATNYFGMFDRDGGGAMGAIFIMGPILALIVGIVAAIVTAVRTKPV